jgi:hypothetical protein
LPATGDDVYANGYTVTINGNYTAVCLHTNAGGTAVAGGLFQTSGAVTITANSLAGTTKCLQLNAGGIQTGNSTGGAANTAYGTYVTTGGTHNGTSTGGSAAGAHGTYCYNGGIHNGDSYGGSVSGAIGNYCDQGGIQNGDSHGSTTTTGAHGTYCYNGGIQNGDSYGNTSYGTYSWQGGCHNGDSFGGGTNGGYGTYCYQGGWQNGSATGGSVSGAHGTYLTGGGKIFCPLATGTVSGAFGVTSVADRGVIAYILAESGSYAKSLGANADTTLNNFTVGWAFVPAVGNVKDGVTYNNGTMEGEYPTTETTAAAQKATDAAFLETNKDEIVTFDDDILAEFGVTGTAVAGIPVEDIADADYVLHGHDNYTGGDAGTLAASNIGTRTSTSDLTTLMIPVGMTIDDLVGVRDYTDAGRHLAISNRSTTATVEANGSLTDGVTTTVAAYRPRTELALASTMPTVETILEGWEVHAVDLDQNVMLGFPAGFLSLQTIPIGGNTPTTVLTPGDYTVDGVTMDRCTNVCIMADGSWLAIIAKYSTEQGCFARSTNHGESWTVSALYSNFMNTLFRVAGNYVSAATYPPGNTTDAVVYVSPNCGLTFHIVATLAAPDDGSPWHAHFAAWKMNADGSTDYTTLFVQTGDRSTYPYRSLFKLVQPEGYEYGDETPWTVTEYPNSSPEDGESIPGKIALTVAGIGYTSGTDGMAELTFFDIETEKYSIPSMNTGRSQRQRRMTYCSDSGLMIIGKHNYAAAGPEFDGALEVSLEGERFAVIHRCQGSHRGIRYIVAGGVFGNYLYFNKMDNAGVVTSCRMPSPLTKTIQAVRCEPALTNILDAVDSYGGSGTLGWGPVVDGYGVASVVAASSIPGQPFGSSGNVLQFYNETGTNDTYMQGKTFAAYGKAPPTTGKYCLTAILKCTDAPYGRLYMMRAYAQGGTASFTNIYRSNCTVGDKPGWHVTMHQLTADALSTHKPILRWSRTGGSAFGYNIWVGKILMAIDDDPNLLYRSFQDEVARGNESVTIPLGALADAGQVWSIRVKFRLNGDYDLLPDQPVFTILGRGDDYLALTWDSATSTFILTDGTNTLSSLPMIPSYRFDAYDVIITSDGSTTTLYVQDPLNGTNSDTSTDAILSTAPREIILGADATYTSYGQVVVLHLEPWASTLTAGEVTAEFAKPGNGFALAFPAVANVFHDVDNGDGDLGTLTVANIGTQAGTSNVTTSMIPLGTTVDTFVGINADKGTIGCSFIRGGLA